MRRDGVGKKRRRVENGLDDMSVTLDTSHFEMSELNLKASENTAESKKRKRERSIEENSERTRKTKR